MGIAFAGKIGRRMVKIGNNHLLPVAPDDLTGISPTVQENIQTLFVLAFGEIQQTVPLVDADKFVLQPFKGLPEIRIHGNGFHG